MSEVKILLTWKLLWINIALNWTLSYKRTDRDARFAGGVRVNDARSQRQDQQQASRSAHASAALDLQDGRGRGKNAIH